MLKGTKVKLHTKVKNGVDEFGHPNYEEKTEIVENVLIGLPVPDDLVTQFNLEGKKTIYVLAIPKGDNHVWEGNTVEFFDKKWHVFTAPVQGIESNIPLKWNKKVMVECYE